jgi:hypothetical protein
MARTAADILIDTLCDGGVEVVFGLPGDGINGIMEALRVRQDTVRFIQVRHEESAALMACAYAKFTGRLGVCLATSGPGGLHLLNGLYDAKLDQQPVLAITGHHYHDLIATYAQQDVDLDVVFRDVAVYTARVMSASHVESVAALACRTALAYRGVSHINFPVDLQEAIDGARSARNVPGHTSDVFARGARVAGGEDLRRAAEVLNAGRKIAILAGQGALGRRPGTGTDGGNAGRSHREGAARKGRGALHPAPAAQDHGSPGRALRRVPGQGRAEPRQDRPDRPARRGPGAHLRRRPGLLDLLGKGCLSRHPRDRRSVAIGQKQLGPKGVCGTGGPGTHLAPLCAGASSALTDS